MKIAHFDNRYWDDMYEVCLCTGDSGQDGRRLHSDSKILGHIYVGPYLKLCPEFALMLLNDSEKGVGYCLAALDTEAFFAQAKNAWFPALRQEYQGIDKSTLTPQDLECLTLIDDYPLYYSTALADYPAHLHIDLLPEAQGLGMGKALIEKQCQLLADAGSPGAHIVMAASNHKAHKFYQRMSFSDFEAEGMFTGNDCIMVIRF